MIRSGSHTGDLHGLIFPAIITQSKPVDRPDVPETDNFRFPRYYEWVASSSSQVVSDMLEGVLVGAACLNLMVPYNGWALNKAEGGYDLQMNNTPVPRGTPVIICIGPQPSIVKHPPKCEFVLPMPWIVCAPPHGLWFYHWCDPPSFLCNT